MSDFLTNVLARSTGRADTVQPRLPSRFEPLQSIPQEIIQESLEQPSSLSITSPEQSLTPFSLESAQGQVKSTLQSVEFEPANQSLNPNSDVEFTNNPNSVFQSTNLTSLTQPTENAASSLSTTPLEPAQENSDLIVRPQRVEQNSLSSHLPLVAHVPESVKTEVRSLVLQPQITSIQEPDSSPQLPAQPEPPVIKVTIGRVEIRATASPISTPPSRSASKPPQPTLSLENYLKSRNGGGG
jgi:hypothetical protein